MSEIWKTVNGYDDYQVSNMGRVKSFKKDKENGVILTPYRGSSTILNKEELYGTYMRVELYNEFGSKIFKVHRLVAITFIPNPKKLPQVNHKNGIKTDNRVENLEWCDATYNINHSLQILHIDKVGNSKSLNTLKSHVNKRNRGVRKTYHRKREYKVVENQKYIDLSCDTNIVMLSRYGEIISTFKCIDDVLVFMNIKNDKPILKCCNKEKYYNFAFGYMWRFAKDVKEMMNYKDKAVIQSTEQGIFINQYKDVFEAAKNNDFDIIKLLDCLNKKSKTSFKFKWFFKEEYNEVKTNKWRSVVKLTLDGDFIEEYSSITEAAKKNDHAHVSSIYLACQTDRRTAGGFRWMYKDNYIEMYNLVEKDIE